jgi:hypothetical protein
MSENTSTAKDVQPFSSRKSLMVYYSMLRSLLLTGGGVSNIRKFSYASLEEHRMWSSGFSDAAPSKQLLCYAMIEELRTLIERNPLPSLSRLVEDHAQNLWLFPITILGLFWGAVAKDSMVYSIRGIDGSKALIDFLDLCAEWAKMLEDQLPHIDEKDELGPSMLFGIARIYVESTYFRKWEKLHRASISLALEIKNSRILSKFSSLYELSQQGILGVPKSEKGLLPGELNSGVIFAKEFPLWINSRGYGSLFSYLFRGLLPPSEKQTLLGLEYLRLFFYGDKVGRNIIAKNTSLFSAKRLVLRKTDAPKTDSLDEDSLEAKILQAMLSGEGAAKVVELQNFALSKRLLETKRSEIEEIVRDEMKKAYRQFRELSERGYSDNDAADILRLFLVNIFEKAQRLITEEYPVFFDRIEDERHLEATGKTLAEMIYSPIREIKSEEGWL